MKQKYGEAGIVIKKYFQCQKLESMAFEAFQDPEIVSHFGLKTKRTDDGTVSFRKLEVGLPQLSNPVFKLPFGLMNFS